MTKEETKNIKDEILRKEGSLNIGSALIIDGVVLIKDVFDILNKYTEERGGKK